MNINEQTCIQSFRRDLSKSGWKHIDRSQSALSLTDLSLASLKEKKKIIRHWGLHQTRNYNKPLLLICHYTRFDNRSLPGDKSPSSSLSSWCICSVPQLHEHNDTSVCFHTSCAIIIAILLCFYLQFKFFLVTRWLLCLYMDVTDPDLNNPISQEMKTVLKNGMCHWIFLVGCNCFVMCLHWFHLISKTKWHYLLSITHGRANPISISSALERTGVQIDYSPESKRKRLKMVNYTSSQHELSNRDIVKMDAIGKSSPYPASAVSVRVSSEKGKFFQDPNRFRDLPGWEIGP